MARTPPKAPAALAIERLAKLAMAGTPAARMVTTTGGILAGWRDEGLSPGDLRDRVVTLHDDVTGGVMAAEDYVAEADSDKGRAIAQNQIDALTAVQAFLADALDTMG